MSGRFSPEVMGGMGRLWHAPSGRAVAGRERQPEEAAAGDQPESSEGRAWWGWT